jgi:hypothetical protein
MASNATHTQAHLSGTIIWPSRCCRPYASGPDALARSDAKGTAVAGASQGPRAQGQTNVYEQGTHQAELRHRSEREQG